MGPVSNPVPSCFCELNTVSVSCSFRIWFKFHFVNFKGFFSQNRCKYTTYKLWLYTYDHKNFVFYTFIREKYIFLVKSKLNIQIYTYFKI